MSEAAVPEKPSSPEVMMELVRGIRARSLTRVTEVKALSRELFPELSEEEHQACLMDLAKQLTRDLTPYEMAEARRRARNRHR